MAYTPPNTFTTATALTAADVEGNAEELRAYLHEDVAVGDFEASQWIQTRHIQPPLYQPYTGTQHGVSGHLAGQNSTGLGVRLSFCTSYLTGNGIVGAEPSEWMRIPNTTFQIDIHRPYKGFMHWWMELEHGPDNVPYVADHNYQINERLNWIAPFIGTPGLVDKTAAQEGQNHQGPVGGGGYWATTQPIGARWPYTGAAGYGQRDGCVKLEGSSIQTLTAGLCYYGQIDRVGIVNWGIALEVYYI
jgi:hypothetical protein